MISSSYADVTYFLLAFPTQVPGQSSSLILIGLLILVIAVLVKQLRERTSQLKATKNEVEELSNLKTVCLQAVAHDLRTSMMGMSMILKSLQNRPHQPISLSRTTLEPMIESNDRALNLINAVSERLECNYSQIDLQLQPTSFAKIVIATLNKLNQRCLVNQIIIDNLVPENLPKVKADPSQIQRVLEHLISNTIQHNSVQVKVTINATVKQNKICCTVADNGIGMTSQQRQSLFKLYVRNLYNPRLTGVGLGLYLCQQIIKAHGEEIGINSQPNRGTTVWFTLPLALVRVDQLEVSHHY